MMSKSMPRSIALAAAAATCFAAACTGKGGGGSGPAPIPEPPIDCASTDSDAAPAPFPAGSFGHARGANGGVFAVGATADGRSVYVGGGFTKFDSAVANGIERLTSRGARNPNLRSGAGFDNYVWALLPAGDGSGDIYVAGSFDSYDGVPVHGIARLNCDGALDQGFLQSQNASYYALASAPDGSGDLFAGGNKGITRLNRDGSADWTLSTSTVFALALARDGSGDLLAGGSFGVLRLRSDGTPDLAFHRGAFDCYECPFPDVYALVPAGDGSGDILVGGGFTGYEGTASGHFIRLNGDGSLDTAFPVGFGYDVWAMTPAGDDSSDIYVGGAFRSYDGNVANRIIRLHVDGTVADTFVTGAGFDDVVYALRPVPDGSGALYVGGAFTGYNGVGADRIARLGPDGSIDGDFRIPSRFKYYVTSLVPAPDGSGKVYAVNGENYDGVPTGGLVRISPTGELDTTFNKGSGFDGGVNSVCAAPDDSGDIYVAGGFNNYDGASAKLIARLHDDGTRDSGFSVPSGVLIQAHVVAPATDNSRRVYVSGAILGAAPPSTSHYGVIRLLEDGSVDPDFSSDVDLGSFCCVSALAPVADGSVYVGGNFSATFGAPADGLLKLKPDGTLDTAFAVSTDISIDFVESIVLTDDLSGDLHVGGSIEKQGGGYLGLVRLRADGSVNPGFTAADNASGSVIVPVGDGSGDLYVGGYGAVKRLKPDGSINTSFQPREPNDDGSFVIAPVGDGSGDIYAGKSDIRRLRSDGGER